MLTYQPSKIIIMAIKETMSVTQGLTELKLLESRIEKCISSLTAYKVSNSEEPEFEKKVRADYQSCEDLERRRAAIKAAIVMSNATTKVKIGKLEYTVAEAIELKGSIKFKEQRLKRLQGLSKLAYNALEEKERKYEEALERHIQTVSNNKELTKDSAWLSQVRSSFEEAVPRPRLHDPLNCEVLVTELSNEIEDFKTNVDVALSVINAKTEIVVEY